ncbi:unnamed protein product [Ambrosiozyma monospora]|uniref:Unnamed protein product n=1 Tax=Ambrosiozyma monospora TaxID=43982 RepID=A0ACB5T8E8_AMBMO|nr:unnamed protein product [Ambrosiozyma monospora]
MHDALTQLEILLLRPGFVEANPIFWSSAALGLLLKFVDGGLDLHSSNSNLMEAFLIVSRKSWSISL